MVAHALGVLTGRNDTTFLVGGAAATAGIQEVLDAVDDERVFAVRYSGAVRAALLRAGSSADGAAIERELAHFGQLLGPVRRLLRGAHAAGLRVIAYQDGPSGDGLTRFLKADMETEVTGGHVLVRPDDASEAPDGHEHRNGL
jgi:hypothetical protein